MYYFKIKKRTNGDFSSRFKTIYDSRNHEGLKSLSNLHDVRFFSDLAEFSSGKKVVYYKHSRFTEKEVRVLEVKQCQVKNDGTIVLAYKQEHDPENNFLITFRRFLDTIQNVIRFELKKKDKDGEECKENSFCMPIDIFNYLTMDTSADTSLLLFFEDVGDHIKIYRKSKYFERDIYIGKIKYSVLKKVLDNIPLIFKHRIEGYS